MKSKYIYSVLMALGLASAAQAATYDIYITGSTAGRKSVTKAIQDLVVGEVIAANNSDLGKADYLNFTGGTRSGDTYNVYCAYYGSVGGVGSLVNNSTVNFMQETAAGTYTSPTLTRVHTADIAFADVFQSSTPYADSTPLTQHTNYNQGTCVLPFVFHSSEGSPITNVTTNQARVIFGTGNLKLSLFTGLVGDATKRVLTCGRNNDSGTRTVTMAESGVGATSNIKQYKPVLTPAGAKDNAIAGIVHTPATAVVQHTTLGSSPVVAGQPVTGVNIPSGTTVLSVNSATQFTMSAASTGAISGVRIGLIAASLGDNGSGVGIATNGGESSGSTVAGYASAITTGLTLSGQPAVLLTYLGVGDGTTATTNGSVSCTFNGTQYLEDNVKNGRYTLWGYLHLYSGSGSSSEGVAFADLLKDEFDVSATAVLTGILQSDMKVERGSDGGDVTPL